jgi:hypothetical protein
MFFVLILLHLIYCFRNLKSLLLFDLPEVKDKSGCKAHIEKALPDCKVDYRDLKK